MLEGNLPEKPDESRTSRVCLISIRAISVEELGPMVRCTLIDIAQVLLFWISSLLFHALLCLLKTF